MSEPPKHPAEDAFNEYVRSMREPASGTGPRVRRKPSEAEDLPEGSTAAAFDRYLEEVEPPQRKSGSQWDRATIILVIVEVGIAAAVLVWWLAGVFSQR